MGADLYIRKVFRPHEKKMRPAWEAALKERDALSRDDPKYEAAQQRVHDVHDAMYSKGYFRDSYNLSSVLAIVGLSWWRDVIPMLNARSNLKGDALVKFRAMVEERTVPRLTREQLVAMGFDNDVDVDEWQSYFDTKREQLILFLGYAISHKLPVYCSL